MRFAFLLLGCAALVAGIIGGLARSGINVPAPSSALALHGTLMVSGFFGTVIALERAVALGKHWAYAAPLASGAGGVALLLGFTPLGLGLMALGALGLTAASIAAFARQPSLEMATLLGGAFAWLAGNTLLIFGMPAVPWWIAFFALTIGGERLELSRYLRRSRWSRFSFILLALALLFTPLVPRIMGAVLLLLSLWLFRYDLARVTLRQSALPRYVAVCLLAGYAWLALGGLLLAAGAARDASLHAIFVGFVFSMVFGHAPVILPAVLRVALPYSPALYAPLALLHASLAVRVFADFRAIGAAGNAVAIVLFIATAATLVSIRQRQRRSPPS